MKASRRSIEQAVETVRQTLAESIAPGEPGAVVLVSSRGESVAWAAAGLSSLETLEPLTVQSSLDTGSVAKAVTGLAMAILEEEGSVSPSLRVRDLLPAFPVYGDAVRVEHLLHHESGLRNYFSLLYYMAGWHPRHSPTPDDVFETLCRAGSLTFEPGSRYEYCDSNYFLLARIVERVSGERFGAFIQSRVFDPLGMTNAYISDVPGADTPSLMAAHAPVAPAVERLAPQRAEGYVEYAMELRSSCEQRGPDVAGWFHPVRLNYQHVGAEGFYASAADLARLAKHILAPTLVAAETMRDRVLRALRMRDDGLGYAYGLNVGTYRGRRFIGHDGQIWGYTASLAVFPEDEVEIVCLTNRADLGAWQLRSRVLDALDGKSLGGSSRGAPASRPRVVGRYLSPATARYLEIAESASGRTVSMDGGGASTFEPFDDGRSRDAFLEYEGAYCCSEVATTYDVEATEMGIHLRNRDRRRPSMDLDYAPTIRDFFRSLDPYPELSQLQFLREEGAVCAFVYRDPDGDRREDFRFVRMAG